MVRSIPRGATAAIAGVLAGAVCLAVAFTTRPDLTLEMDRDLPGLMSGFYPIERENDRTFAWTRPRAEVRLAGVDRRLTWRCSVRLRGARPGELQQPRVDLSVDGVTAVRETATNEFQDLDVLAPARPSARGLILSIASAPAFVPGPGDRRELGVQVDRITCRPDAARALPAPRGALAAAALGAAVFGAALGVSGFTAWGAVAGALLLAAAQAIPLSSGPGPYSGYVNRVVWLALGMALPMLLAVTVLEWGRRQPLHPAARFVVALSAGALYLKLLALLHPSKLVVDALFHAHRLDWVLGGRFYFTQPMPDGVQFPYAIGLYLFAAPWSLLTADHVMLLRVVVSAAEAVAGALLYVMIVRTWGDRLAGALAVVLFHLVPLPYWVVGNANLTNAFGQSAALVALAAATVWPLQARHARQAVVLTALTALAFLSHVSTIAMLAVTLLSMAFFCWWRGGPMLRAPARWIFVATMAAGVVSVVTYYGHFGEAYRSARQVRAEARAAPADPARAAEVAPTPPHLRVVRAVTLAIRDVGWPILLLAIAGAWRVWRSAPRDRLLRVLAAWGLACLVFMAFGTLVPVDPRFERYADEFISRVNFATYPAAVILAAYGVAWAWRAGPGPRLASTALLLAALAIGGQQWLRWLQ